MVVVYCKIEINQSISISVQDKGIKPRKSKSNCFFIELKGTSYVYTRIKFYFIFKTNLVFY